MTRPRPHPHCTLCGEKPCAYHRLSTGQDFEAALRAGVRERGVVELARCLEASQATLAPLGELCRGLDSEPLDAAMARLLEHDQWTTADLRRLAALCLARAYVAEAGADDDDTEDDHDG